MQNPNYFKDFTSLEDFINEVEKRTILWIALIRQMAAHQLNEADYQDILAEFRKKLNHNFVRIVANHPDYSIHYYLPLILRRIVIDYLRRKSRFVKVSEDYYMVTPVSVTENSDFLIEDLCQQINSFFHKVLNIKEQNVMELVIQEYKDSEIAEKLKLPLNTIATLKRRARNKLEPYRKLLASMCL